MVFGTAKGLPFLGPVFMNEVYDAADPGGIHVRYVESRHLDGLYGRVHGELREAGHAPGLLLRDARVGIEALDLAGYLAVEPRRVEGGYPRRSVRSLDELGPELLYPAAQGGDDSRAGDDDSFAPHDRAPSPHVPRSMPFPLD
jgi:hypothetical protein